MDLIWTIQAADSTQNTSLQLILYEPIWGVHVQSSLTESTRSSGSCINMKQFQGRQDLQSRVVALLYWKRTNFMESDNNSILQCGLRVLSPDEILSKVTVAFMGSINKRNSMLKKWREKTDSSLRTPRSNGTQRKHKSQYSLSCLARTQSTLRSIGGTTNRAELTLVNCVGIT